MSPVPSRSDAVGLGADASAQRERVEAFERAYRQVNPSVERAMRAIAQRDLARFSQDAIAEAWLKLWRTPSVALDQPKLVRAWMVKAARTTALDMQALWVERSSALSLDAEWPDGSTPALHVADDIDVEDSVVGVVDPPEGRDPRLALVDALPDRQRRALLLQAEGLTHDSIAHVTGLTRRRVAQAITDGRAAVRDQLARDRLRERDPELAARVEAAEGERAQRLAARWGTDVADTQLALFPGMA